MTASVGGYDRPGRGRHPPTAPPARWPPPTRRLVRIPGNAADAHLRARDVCPVRGTEPGEWAGPALLEG
ncbi:hypothetical protein [Streptomyces sp. NPDC029003]|uniref:hypothetical protein n=1 Tax=Streptomyces sp. NPDC029003 TaxID=3155125 RepID=UPI0033DB64CE